MRYFYLFLYYFICKNLPRSYQFGIVGRVSSRLRRFVCRKIFNNAPKNIFIEKGANFGSGRKVVMDEFACIGENARFMGEGKIIIGKHAMMGPDVMIVTSDHKMKREGFDGYISKDVIIGDYAWIGARAIILKGVKVGKYAVVGAGAVITKDIEPYAIAVGNPARVVKFRNNENE